MTDDYETRVVPVSDSVEAQAYHWHREGTNDYTNDGHSIVRVVDNEGRTLEPVWEDEWTGIAPGIESCRRAGKLRVRIHRRACPVRVLMCDWREYVSYTDADHSSSHSRHYWVEYEADALGWRPR